MSSFITFTDSKASSAHATSLSASSRSNRNTLYKKKARRMSISQSGLAIDTFHFDTSKLAKGSLGAMIHLIENGLDLVMEY